MNGENTHLIITGAAPDVLEDVAAVPRVCAYDYMCIGKTASTMHRIPCKYLATYHPVQLPEIRRQRENSGCNLDYIVISHDPRPGVDIIEALAPGERSGSSALLGALAALKLGYRRIVLCGCPLTGKNLAGGDYDNFRIGWTNKQKFLDDRVRSMSGWTAELLGRPTDEWLLEAL